MDFSTLRNKFFLFRTLKAKKAQSLLLIAHSYPAKTIKFMLFHNITYNIDINAEADFLDWMRNTHIPNVMLSGFPKSFQILKLLTEIDNGGVTYSVQYFFDSIEGFEVYENDYLDDFNFAVDKRYRGKYVFFASLLQEI